MTPASTESANGDNYIKHQQINQLLHENQEHVRHLNEGEEEKTKTVECITKLEEEELDVALHATNSSWTTELPWLVRLHLSHRLHYLVQS